MGQDGFDELAAQVGRLARECRLTIGGAESLTSGLVSYHLGTTPRASEWYRGCMVSFETPVKHDVLGVTTESVVSSECALQMARGARKLLGSDVAYATTGVAGPHSLDGESPGTVWLGIVGPAGRTAVCVTIPGDPPTVIKGAVTACLDLLTQQLAALSLVGSGWR